MVPIIQCAIVCPEPLLNERSFLRMHNRCAKEALRDEGVKHHQTRIPGHFARSAHAKYGYKDRRFPYIRFKARRFHSVTDLVKSGATKAAMTGAAPKMRLGGRASDESGTSGGLALTLEYRFPFGLAAQAAVARAIRAGRLQRGHVSGEHRSGVTIDQMRKEIATIMDDEAKDIGRGFLRGYGHRLSEALARAPRIRKRVQAATAARKAA